MSGHSCGFTCFARASRGHTRRATRCYSSLISTFFSSTGYHFLGPSALHGCALLPLPLNCMPREPRGPITVSTRPSFIAQELVNLHRSSSSVSYPLQNCPLIPPVSLRTASPASAYLVPSWAERGAMSLHGCENSAPLFQNVKGQSHAARGKSLLAPCNPGPLSRAAREWST